MLISFNYCIFFSLLTDLVLYEAKELQVTQLTLFRAVNRKKSQISISGSACSEGDMFLALSFLEYITEKKEHVTLGNKADYRISTRGFSER